MFRGAEVVAGFAGSALFTTAFCPSPRRVIALGPASYLARNEYMICAVLGHELDYVWSEPEPVETGVAGRSAGFRFDFEREGVYLKGILPRCDGPATVAEPRSRIAPLGGCGDNVGPSVTSSCERERPDVASSRLAEGPPLLDPRTYFEIGVHIGMSLTLSRARSVAVDPFFKITRELRSACTWCGRPVTSSSPASIRWPTSTNR